jgi:hypothetical protein
MICQISVHCTGFLPIEREPGDAEEGLVSTSEDGEKERPVSPGAPSDDSKVDTNKLKKHLVRMHKYYNYTLTIYVLLHDRK